MKKKVLLVLLAAAMILPMAACSNDGTPSSTAPGSSQTSSAKEEKIPGIGESAQSDVLKITLTGAKMYDEIKEGEIVVAKPKDGKKYLVLFLEAENLSDQDDFINMLYYEAYADDKSISSTTLIAKPEGEGMFSGDIAKGKRFSGYVAYEVDKDWKSFEFTYKDGTKYTFAFTADDIK